jgi:hypothetical protein
MCQGALQEYSFRIQLFVKRPTGDCNSILLQAGEATGSVGQSHSSDKGSVMEQQRRALLIWSKYCITTLTIEV